MALWMTRQGLKWIAICSLHAEITIPKNSLNAFSEVGIENLFRDTSIGTFILD